MKHPLTLPPDMYANVVTTPYKSPHDLEEAIPRVEQLLPELKQIPGFRHFRMVRTGETETVHVAAYDSPDAAEEGRTRMLPKFRDAVAPHASGAPRVLAGEVLIES